MAEEVTRDIADILHLTYDWVARKYTEVTVPLATIYAAHPAIRALEASMEQAALANDLPTVKDRCREYCTTWGRVIQQVTTP